MEPPGARLKLPPAPLRARPPERGSVPSERPCGTDIGWFGLIGSATKRARFVRRWRERGVSDEALTSVLDKANKVVRDIAQKDHYDIIFQEAVYVNPRIDITDKVLKALDAQSGK